MKSMLFFGMLLLSACGSAIPMAGEATDGEQFIGSLTARGRDYGAIDMRNSSGVECNGIWQLDSQRSGSASFTCTDGRTGTAELSVGDAAAGTMKGVLGWQAVCRDVRTVASLGQIVAKHASMIV